MPASDKCFYNLKTLHVVFALSSAVMLVSAIWMMAADHNDEWRRWQSKWDKVQSRRLQDDMRAIQTEKHQSEVARLREKMSRADSELKQNEAAINKLSDEVEPLSLDVDWASRAVRDRRAQRDVARANYDLGIHQDRPPAALARLKAIFDREQGEVDRLELQLQQKETRLQLAQKELEKGTRRRDAAEAELKKPRARAT